MPKPRTIAPCLWFDGNAEEAVEHYVSIFRDARVLRTVRFGKAGPGPEGAVMLVEFQLEGREFLALNGGPAFAFTEAISLAVHCETQEEIDALWTKLSSGGEEGRCGWLKDRFGVSWQVVPAALPAMMQDEDPERVRRVTETMFPMGKLDVARLEEAYRGAAG